MVLEVLEIGPFAGLVAGLITMFLRILVKKFLQRRFVVLLLNQVTAYFPS